MPGMRDEMWEELRGDLPTPACRRGEHVECAHLSTIGGGFNPRRFRFEAGAGPCPCACHRSCPSADGTRLAIPVRVWRERCTCPGADALRQRLEASGFDFRDPREQFEERSRSRREALHAVRAAAEGKTRDEIRQLYVDEMRSRGLKVPSDDIVEAHLDWIKGNPLPALRLAGTGLAQVGRGIVGLYKIFHSAANGRQ